MNKELKFLVYNTPEKSDVFIKAVVKDETIWLTQKAMSELFDVGVPAISKHVKNIYEEGELKESMTISKMETVVNRGFRGEVIEPIDFYNLDMIISVGYRVNSRKATHFRIWATGVLKEYITKGFAMDDERLKQGKTAFGKDYFKELLERVRSIRASERRIWLQITDIFRECSIDYDKNGEAAKAFYAMVQNKFHFATSINEFLSFRKYTILEGKGKISKAQAENKAVAEYDHFNKTQKIDSDFEKQIKKLLEKGNKE